jgi:hypothetical protein
VHRILRSRLRDAAPRRRALKDRGYSIVALDLQASSLRWLAAEPRAIVIAGRRHPLIGESRGGKSRSRVFRTTQPSRVLNAGVRGTADLETDSMDTFDRSIAVNLRADVAGRGEPGLAVTRVPAYGGSPQCVVVAAGGRPRWVHPAGTGRVTDQAGLTVPPPVRA